jgi:rod shape-determining protein MreD
MDTSGGRVRTRRIVVLILALTAASILQSTIASRPILLGARVDLVLLLVVTYSVIQGVGEGLLGGLFGGFVVDVLSAVPFGSAMIGMGMIAVLTGIGKSNVYRANVLIPLVAVFLATVFYHAFLMLALQADGRAVDWMATLALQTIPGACLNALLTPVAFFMMRRFAFQDENEEQFRW